jgi:uncharacterized protein
MIDPKDDLIRCLILKMVCAMVGRPEDVRVEVQTSGDVATFSVHVHFEDVGKVIGKQGRSARSLRTIIAGVGRKLQRQPSLVIEEQPILAGQIPPDG